ncbi:hypothetical protein NM208_g13831 [Fusarium decemcellulare]|uniref:Uncharacterized protein n=1 Tax=Fusarium decemcellulare TaxID=57161 RepID=A0ACC1RMJ2_9HYPO|nr:hypothetical protein NM208_g13831 [Fusarium decemcellulare]
MKFLNIVGFALSTVQAMPANAPRGVRIRDEATLERLKASHDATIKALKDGTAYYPGSHALQARQVETIAGLAGFAIVELFGALGGTVAGLENKLIDLFTSGDQDEIWHNHGHCRTYFQTQGGGNCETRTYERDSGDATATHDDGDCAWIDPENNDPPVVYYEGDPGIGKYSIQYTATDEYTWDEVEGSEKCSVQGLCNPQYVFYRDDYNLVLSTWQSQGDVSACSYSGGDDCKGLCMSGVKNQFKSGGQVWGGDCAIPCEDEATLPDE